MKRIKSFACVTVFTLGFALLGGLSTLDSHLAPLMS